MTIEQQIVPYLHTNAGEALGITDFNDATIEQLHGGDYNHNYHVNVADHDGSKKFYIPNDELLEFSFRAVESLNDMSQCVKKSSCRPALG